ncbi:MAG: tetratricopeptide repeat protein [Cyanobacteria bacterium P01_D01_bin.73]
MRIARSGELPVINQRPNAITDPSLPMFHRLHHLVGQWTKRLKLQQLTAFCCAVLLSMTLALTSGDAWAAEPLQWDSEEEMAAAISEAIALTDEAFDLTNRGNYEEAEAVWTRILKSFPYNAEIWSNRGNARASQMKLNEAIEDYEQAIALAPDAPDPYLNRGAALENMGQWEAAIADYDRVLDIDPEDAAAYNNRGNAQGGLGNWDNALEDFKRASDLGGEFVIARENYALALYQTGNNEEALRQLRNLVRKYPRFADARAALTAVLWDLGDQGEAESQWVSVVGLDRRYKDINWVRDIRRWPPSVTQGLDRFLKL